MKHTSSSKRLRVLLIAEAANPQRASVPLVGWSSSQAIARRCDAHLVTHVRNRDDILAAGLREGVDFTAIDSDRVAGPMYKLAMKMCGGFGKGWTIVTAMKSLAYLYFERLLWRRFGQAIQSGAYDVVHRLTPLSPTAASPIAKRCARANVPFVVGPLNGGLPWPAEYNDAQRREREWLTKLRGAHKLMPGYRATRQHASAIIVASKATWSQVPAAYQHKCVYIPENGIDPDGFAVTGERPSTPPLRIAYIGRLTPYKNPDVVIAAAAPLLRSGRAQLDIVGDGPMMNALRQQVQDAQLGESVRFHGLLPHAGVWCTLARSHVMAFPSIREFGGGVALEAMWAGATPIVVDYGGPGELVSHDAGYKLPMCGKPKLTELLTQTLTRIADRPDDLAARRSAGIERVRRWLTWNRKAEQIEQVYRWVLGQRATAPGLDHLLDEPAEARPWAAA